MTMCAFADVHIKREGLGDPAQGLEATGKASHKGSGCSGAFRSLEQEEWAASPVEGGGAVSVAGSTALSLFICQGTGFITFAGTWIPRSAVLRCGAAQWQAD